MSRLRTLVVGLFCRTVVLSLAVVLVAITSALSSGPLAEQTAEAQGSGPSVVTSIPRVTHSLGTEQVGGFDAHVVTLDVPNVSFDYKWQFLQNGVRLFIDRQDGNGWVQLVSEIQTAPEYMKQQGAPGNFNWNPYGLNENTSGSNVLQGYDRQDQGDGSVILSRTYDTDEEGEPEVLTETWTIPASSEDLALKGPKAAYVMTQNRGIVVTKGVNEGTWRMRWALSGIADITADNSDIRDGTSDNWPIRRRTYSNEEFVIAVDDFDNLQTTANHTFSEISASNKAEILFFKDGTTGAREVDPTTVTSNIGQAWSKDNMTRNVFYNGTNFFVIYDKGDEGTTSDIYYKAASTVSGLSSATETVALDNKWSTNATCQAWDVYVVNDAEIDIVYNASSSTAAVQTCTISGATLDCTTKAASATVSGGDACGLSVVRTPSADRLWISFTDGGGTAVNSANTAGDSDAMSGGTWAEESDGAHSDAVEDSGQTLVPFNDSDAVIHSYAVNRGGSANDDIWGDHVTRSAETNYKLNVDGTPYNADAIGTIVRVSDTDFRGIFIDENSDVLEKSWTGSAWGSAATVHTGTDKNPTIFYNRLDDDLYGLYADSSDDIWYHKRASGGAWGSQTDADAGEADANSMPVTQMHEPPLGSSRTNSNIRFPWCYRNANSSNYDIVCEAVDISTAGGPTFTLNDYRWYVDSDAENVTDPWSSVSGVDIAENTAITPVPVHNDPPDTGQELRLRANVTVTGTLDTSSQQFKLQFKEGTDSDCTTGSWTDVGAGQQFEFASSSVTDGADLTALKLAASDVSEVYVKSNPTTTNPNSATTGQDIEYDFHLTGTGSASAAQYSFKVVESDGTALGTYTTCPTLTTEPTTVNLLRHGMFFADEVKQGFFWAN